jgi:hypothetical protein
LISKIQTNGGHLAFTKWEFVNIIMPSTYGTGVNYYGVITLQVPDSRNARQKLLKLATTSLQTMFFFPECIYASIKAAATTIVWHQAHSQS